VHCCFVYKCVENIQCTAVLCINVWKMYSALLFCVDLHEIQNRVFALWWRPGVSEVVGSGAVRTMI